MDEPIREREPSDAPAPPLSTTAAEAFAGYLDELERLCDRASTGPWFMRDGDVWCCPSGEDQQEYIVGLVRVLDFDDGAFVAAARNALPKLIAKVRELQARAENADALREYADKRGVILTERAVSRVCAGCNTKRTGIHCCDCNRELWENDEGVFLAS